MLITLAPASLLAALTWEIGVVGYTQHSLRDPQKVPTPFRHQWCWTQPRLGNAAKHQELTKTVEEKTSHYEPRRCSCLTGSVPPCAPLSEIQGKSTVNS